MSVKDDLIAAKALIDSPEKWAHESSDRVYEGGRCLCAFDAANKVCDDWKRLAKIERALTKQLPSDFAPDVYNDMIFVAQFNDAPTATHADIMALFDRAINAAEAS